MRALAPLPAVLLLAASAAACPFGYPGHTHPSLAAAAEAQGLPPLPAGRCNGAGPLPALPRTGAPVDLSASPIAPEDLPSWQVLGYRPTPAGRLLHAADGPLTSDGKQFLEAPWSAAEEKLTVETWNTVMLSGYRLDENTCHLMGPDSKPANRLLVGYVKVTVVKMYTQAGLERLLAALRKLPPGAPVPAQVREMVAQMQAAGVPVPPDVASVLKKPAATVTELRGPASASYLDIQRFFDGQTPYADALGLALPASGGAASRRAPYLDPVEKRFGEVFSAAFAAELGRNPVGKDLLARFTRHGHGTPNLLVLKLTQRPDDATQNALYSPDKDTMVINHWAVAEVVRMKTPPEGRAALEPLLSDSVKLMDYVSKDPALLKAVISEMDVEYFHELLHAEQSRRTSLDDESIRGNAPIANPLDKEREAHREHCRYLIAKAAYDAPAVNASRWRDYCVGMLRDPDAFQDEVTRAYLSTFAGSATGPELADMQEVRRFAANAPASGWIEAGEKLLRRVGLSYGDKALAAFASDMRRRSAAFDAAFPAFRDRAAASLAAGAKDRPELALTYLSIDPQWTASPQAEPVVEAATAWLFARKGDPDALNDRAAVLSLVYAWKSAHKKSVTPELDAIRAADQRSIAERFLGAGQLDQALAYAKASGDQALIARIEAARRAK